MAGDSHQQVMAAAGFLLQVLHSSACWSDDDVLFGNLGLRSIEGVGGLGGEPLAQGIGDFGVQASGSDARFDATENVEPIGIGLLEDAGLAFDHGLHV